jgi:uncharacterized integral membrane protein
MNLRNIVLAAIALALIGFAALNWGAFQTPTSLNLLVTRREAPLGMVLLGVIVFLAMLFLLFSVGVRTSSLMEARRYNKELEGARKLADEAEASRFSQLQAYLEAELEAVKQTMRDEAAATRAELEASRNVLAANIGELEDRLNSGSAAAAPAGDAAQGGGGPA